MALLLALQAGCAALAGGERYRGDYTFGHEVSFCPEINSECYWLGPFQPGGSRTVEKDIPEQNARVV